MPPLLDQRGDTGLIHSEFSSAGGDYFVKSRKLLQATATLTLPPAASNLLSAAAEQQNYHAIASYRRLEDAMRPHHDAKFGGKLELPSDEAIAGMVSTAASPADGPASGFVKACADDETILCVGVKRFYFAGTNLYYLGLPDGKIGSEAQVDWVLQQQANAGVKVIRAWAFANGDWHGSDWTFQPQIGSFNERSFERLDYAIARGGELGIRFILPFVNFWADYNGMAWYVDSVLGAGHALEEFYTDPRVRAAYKAYVSVLLTRVNSVSGVAYKDDPAVMAWELANEPQTSFGYEQDRGITPGTLVFEWAAEMAAFVRSLDDVHLIALGDEGYSFGGDTSGRHGWWNAGGKGLDFQRNLCQIPEIGLASLHYYPQFMAQDIPPSDAAYARDMVFGGRAAMAKKCGKPIVLEEYGVYTDPPYMATRGAFLTQVHGWVKELGFAGALVWQAVPGVAEDGHAHDFAYDGDGGAAMLDLYKTMHARNSAA